MKRIFVFALVAALLLTPLDALQVVFHVRTVGTMPWLTPIKFAVVGAVLGLLSFWLDPEPHPAKTKALIFHGVCFAFAYIYTLYIPNPYYVLSALVINILVQNFISKLWFRISAIEIAPFFLLLITVGPLAEWIDIKFGGFDYTSSPDTIPIWLPFLWASGTYFARSLVGKELETPKDYKWLGKFITFIAPAAQFIYKLIYALTPANIKRLGFVGSFKMAWRN